jgi:hypothetical protein
MKFFVTFVCAECGWSYGPARKRTAKQMAAFHLQVHALEKEANR